MTRRIAWIAATTTAAILAWTTPALAENVLTIHCPRLSHSAQVDPIVSFGIDPSAHMHDFFGNDSTTSTSTADTLLANGNSTSCPTTGDSAAYWFPEPTWNGTPTTSTNMGEYWQRPTGVPVEAPPFGMEYVAGDSHATQPTPHLGWSCGNGAETPTPRDCTGTTTGSKDLTADLTFPECWDGVTTFDGQGGAGIAPTHFAYPISAKQCPTGFTHRIAKLVVHVHFRDPTTGKNVVNPFNPDGTLALGFSSGPTTTFHGDFFNAWDETALQAFIDGCVNKTTPTCPPHA